MAEARAGFALTPPAGLSSALPLFSLWGIFFNGLSRFESGFCVSCSSKHSASSDAVLQGPYISMLMSIYVVYLKQTKRVTSMDYLCL